MEKVRKDERKNGWMEGKEERKEWSEEKWSKNRKMDGRKVEEWKEGNMEGRMDEKMGMEDRSNDGRKKNVKK